MAWIYPDHAGHAEALAYARREGLQVAVRSGGHSVAGNYWSADFHNDLPDAALDVLVASGRSLPSPESQQFVVPWGGAVAVGPKGGSPLTRRESAFVSHPFGIAANLAGGERARDWVRAGRSALVPYANGGVYLNFIGNEGQDRVRAAFGEENYARLARVKKELDPENVFRGNQNVLPA